MQGIIKWFHTVKHIGFLVTDEGNREIFMHLNDCQGFIPEAGIPVNFQMGVDGKGRAKAVKIQRVWETGDGRHKEGWEIMPSKVSQR